MKAWRARGLPLILLVAAFAKTASAQDVSAAELTDWSQRVGYDATRDWRSYLRVAPGTLGPNGLPVWPTLRGRVDTTVVLAATARHHHAPGDRTTDLALAVAVPFGRRASLRVRYLLREWYRVGEGWLRDRDALRAPGAYASAGDVYVEGLFQLWRARRWWPDAALALRVKTASGGDLEGMRHSDSPGYAFDVSFGRDYAVGSDAQLRPYAAGGFFVWQRFGRASPQNDAGTYALGLAFAKTGPRVALRASTELAGYAGYTGRDDAPLVWRGQAGVHLSRRWTITALAERGLVDWAYTTIGLRVGWSASD